MKLCASSVLFLVISETDDLHPSIYSSAGNARNLAQALETGRDRLARMHGRGWQSALGIENAEQTGGTEDDDPCGVPGVLRLPVVEMETICDLHVRSMA